MKQFFLLFGALIILAGVALYFVQSRGTWQITKEPRVPEGKEQTPGVQATSPQTPSETKDLSSVANHLGQLAADFDTQTPFGIQGIWVQDGMWYVEYTNAKGVLAQLLVVKENGTFKGKGYFGPSESRWVLQAGEGDLLKPNAVFYIKDSNGSWKRKN